MLVSEYLGRVRRVLSDTSEPHYRWSDIRLFDIVNSGLYDLATTTILYDTSAYLPLHRNISIYNVSTKVMRFHRFVYHNTILATHTYSEMDVLYPNWLTEPPSKPKVIIYDLSSIGEIRVWPSPFGLKIKQLTETYNSLYGIITGIEMRDYVTINLDDSKNETTLDDRIKIYYTKIPQKVVALDEELDSILTQYVLDILLHYIVGIALRDNIDARDRARASEELQIYNVKKEQLGHVKSTEGITEPRGFGYLPYG